MLALSPKSHGFLDAVQGLVGDAVHGLFAGFEFGLDRWLVHCGQTRLEISQEFGGFVSNDALEITVALHAGELANCLL